MGAQRILGCLSFLFLALASWRSFRERSIGPAARTWFLVGGIFAAVSLALWLGRQA